MTDERARAGSGIGVADHPRRAADGRRAEAAPIHVDGADLRGTVPLELPAAAAPPAAPPRAAVEQESWWERWSLAAAAVLCWSLLVAGVVVRYFAVGPAWAPTALFALAYVAGGTFAAIKALRDLFLERTVSVDFLMITAAAGAAVVGHWEEGAILLGLFSTSNALEHHALGRTQRAVRALMDLSPDVATVLTDGEERVIPVEALRLGDVVLVRPGERVAADGRVVAGETTIDQSAITGESIPVSKAVGDNCFAGTINGYGAIRVRVDRLHQESTLAKIIQFVAQAQAEKSEAQRFTDRFEGWYAVGVIVFSILSASSHRCCSAHTWEPSIYRAMTLLVVASPCALVISTPASTLSALANAARNGILFKGGAALEDIGAIAHGGLRQDRHADLRAACADRRRRPGRRLRPRPSCCAWRRARRSSPSIPLAQAIVRGARERGLPLARGEPPSAPSRQGDRTPRSTATRWLIGNAALFAELGARCRRGVEPVRRTGCATRAKTAMLVGDAEAVLRA